MNSNKILLNKLKGKDIIKEVKGKGCKMDMCIKF